VTGVQGTQGTQGIQGQGITFSYTGLDIVLESCKLKLIYIDGETRVDLSTINVSDICACCPGGS
jgi:hypothetical protein